MKGEEKPEATVSNTEQVTVTKDQHSQYGVGSSDDLTAMMLQQSNIWLPVIITSSLYISCDVTVSSGNSLYEKGQWKRDTKMKIRSDEA